jgi:hypothetical protein
MKPSSFLLVLTLFALSSIVSAQLPAPPTSAELAKLMCRDSNGFDACLAKSYSREAACNGAALCICNELSMKRAFCMLLCLDKATVILKATGEKLTDLYQECVLDQLDKLPTGFPTSGIPTLPPSGGVKPSTTQPAKPASSTKNTIKTDSSTDSGDASTESSGREDSESVSTGKLDSATSSGFNLTPWTFMMIAAIYSML